MQDINKINEWKKTNTKRYLLQLSVENDLDIIRLLEGETNKTAFIKDCIRKVALSTTNNARCSLEKDK